MSCIEYQGKLTKEGYGRHYLNGVRTYAHRHAWMAVNGDIPKGFIVRHLCNNSRCINTDHLALGTIADNNNDKVIAGTTNRGEKCNLAKLNEEQVIEIRKKLDAGLRQKEIAAEYGVDASLISRIATKSVWGWL